MKTLTRIGAALLSTTCLAAGAAAQTELSLWYHGAGNEVERNVLTQIVDDFNASQSDWTVVIEQFPQAAYNDSVTRRRWRANCRTSSTWTGRSCRTGPGLGILRRSLSTRPCSRASCRA
jgi:hypothetical protein